MAVTVHLSPYIDGQQLHQQDPVIDLDDDLSVDYFGVLGSPIVSKTHDKIQQTLTDELKKPTVKQPLEKALTALFLQSIGTTNAKIDDIEIDESGITIWTQRF